MAAYSGMDYITDDDTYPSLHFLCVVSYRFFTISFDWSIYSHFFSFYIPFCLSSIIAFLNYIFFPSGYPYIFPSGYLYIFQPGYLYTYLCIFSLYTRNVSYIEGVLIHGGVSYLWDSTGVFLCFYYITYIFSS